MKKRIGSNLSSKQRKSLFIDLCRGFAVLKSPEEVAKVLTDLLSPREVEMISKRLQIARYLVDGQDYTTIRSHLKVGFSTISRVSTWLGISGDGFKLIFSRRIPAKTRSEEEGYDPFSWVNFKRRYSLYFWPQKLLAETINLLDESQKKKMYKVFDKLEIKKHEFGSEENKLLFDQFTAYFEKKR